MKVFRYGVWALAAVLAAALLAACGGDDAAEDRPTPQPTPQPTVSSALDYDALSMLNVGEPAPDFTLPAVDGSAVSLADFQGQPVLLYFHMAVG